MVPNVCITAPPPLFKEKIICTEPTGGLYEMGLPVCYDDDCCARIEPRPHAIVGPHGYGPAKKGKRGKPKRW